MQPSISTSGREHLLAYVARPPAIPYQEQLQACCARSVDKRDAMTHGLLYSGPHHLTYQALRTDTRAAHQFT